MKQHRRPAAQSANDAASLPTPVSNRPWRVLRIAGMAAFALVVAAEVAVRGLGVVDFPLYDADPLIGYIQQPGQSGAFLNRNKWVINEKSQFGPAWNPTARPNLLLIGDSLVWGGNPYKYDERLGSMLQAELPKQSVWAVGAGSWACWNEIEYLVRYPEVSKNADVLIWIFNTGDFDQRSQWSSEWTHPRQRPVCAAWYVMNKYVLEKRQGSQGAAAETVIRLAAFAAIKHQLDAMATDGRLRKTWIVLYPDRNELRQKMETPLFREALQGLKALATDTVVVVNGGNIPGWRDGFYRDSIHPTEEGNRRLAEFLREQILR